METHFLLGVVLAVAVVYAKGLYYAIRTGWLEMAIKSSSVINLVYSYKANQTISNALPLSADSAKINIISTVRDRYQF